jgi:hypothetical protein
MSAITDAYTSLSKYCISNPFKFCAKICIVHQKLHTWLGFTAPKFNTSQSQCTSQNLTPKNIASTLKNIQHSNNKLWQQDKYIVWAHKQSNL